MFVGIYLLLTIIIMLLEAILVQAVIEARTNENV